MIILVKLIMLNIALLTDSRPLVKDLNEGIKNHLRKQNVNHKISSFFTEDEMKDALKKKYFDIIFLDMNLAGIINHGIVLSKLINYLYPTIQVIFVAPEISNSLWDILSVRYSYVLINSQIEYKLDEAIDTSINNIKEMEGRKITLKKMSISYIVPLNHIVYLEKELRKIHFNLVDSDDIVIYGKLNEYLPILQDGFFQCNQSFIVNSIYVTSYSKNMLVLNENIHVSITSKYRETANKVLSRFTID